MSARVSYRSLEKKPERQHVTLIEKSCGHFGYIRSQYPQNHVSCTQCGLSEHDPERLFVSIIRKQSYENLSIPELSAEELSLWIRQQLEEDNGSE